MRGVSSSSSLQSAVPKSGVGRCTGTRSSGGRRMKTTQKQQQQQPSSSLRASRDDHHHRRRWQQEEEPVRESQQQDQGKVPRANEDHFDDANQRRRETIWLTALGVVLVVASAVLLGILLPARGREDDGSNPSAAFESNGTPSLRPTHVPIDSSSWISLSVLVLQQQSLNANEVTVSSGTVAVIDESIDMGPNAILNIRGEVRCQDNTYIGDDGGRSRSNEEPIVLRLAGITVTGSNAVLSCGTANRPYRGQDLVIELIGTTDVDVAGYGSSAIVVANGGTISLHGKDESKSRYVRLSRTMESGSTFAMVVDVDDSGSSMVSSWEKGDTVVISTTSFYPDRNDYLTVRSVRREGWDDNGGGDFVVEFERPAKWRHYGEIQVFGRGDGHRQRQRRHVVDERAYVANLSRNIRIRGGGVGPDDRGGDTNNIFGVGGGSGIGAHVIITRGGHAYVDSVELEHVGQLGIVGRYPFHWHRVGDASGQYIRNCAIHASYNRCVTIHNTQNAEVTGNTCADFLGHGYFLEEGNEVGNIIQNNLGIDCRKSSNLGMWL